MQDFIVKYWLQTIFGLILAACGAAWGWVTHRVGKQRKMQKALMDGVEALLHDRLYQAHTYHSKKHFISPSDLENIESIYNAYHNLGGNGTGTTIYEELQELPKFQPEQKG